MLAAWDRLRTLKIPLIILGGGPELERLRSEACRQGLTWISFRGQVARDDNLAMMRKARFLVFPSEWYENFPVTIAESFACGVPVICSRMGAMQEIVEDMRTGLHFAAGDDADLAEKIKWAWTHQEEMQQMGYNARCEFETKYTAAKNYPLLMEIYGRAIQRKRHFCDLSPVLVGSSVSQPTLR